MKPEVVYRGKHRRSSLFWLLLSLFLGGSCLGVYFTTPEAGPVMLFQAIAFGLPPFWMSLMDLGKSHGLILNPRTRQLQIVEGFFGRRKTRVYSYDEVREINLTHWNGWRLETGIGGDEAIVLVGWDYSEAARLARHLGDVFGMIPHFNGEHLPPEPVDVTPTYYY